MTPSCQNVADALSDFLDGERGAPEQWEVVLHLEGCVAPSPAGLRQSWQPETSRDALAQHCAAFSGAQQPFFFVSIFIAVSLG